jgi:hypothetical protein
MPWQDVQICVDGEVQKSLQFRFVRFFWIVDFLDFLDFDFVGCFGFLPK